MYKAIIPKPDGYRDDEPFARESKREWWRWHFAGQIAAAYASRSEGPQDEKGFFLPLGVDVAVKVADALIAELEKEK